MEVVVIVTVVIVVRATVRLIAVTVVVALVITVIQEIAVSQDTVIVSPYHPPKVFHSLALLKTKQAKVRGNLSAGGRG